MSCFGSFLVFGNTQKNDAHFILGNIVRVSSVNHNGLWRSSLSIWGYIGIYLFWWYMCPVWHSSSLRNSTPAERHCKLHSGDTQHGFRGSRPSRDDHEHRPWASPQTWCDFATLLRLTATVHLIDSSSLSSMRAMYGEYDRVSHMRNGVGMGRSFAPLWPVFGSCLHDILHLK